MDGRYPDEYEKAILRKMNESKRLLPNHLYVAFIPMILSLVIPEEFLITKVLALVIGALWAICYIMALRIFSKCPRCKSRMAVLKSTCPHCGLYLDPEKIEPSSE